MKKIVLVMVLAGACSDLPDAGFADFDAGADATEAPRKGRDGVGGAGADATEAPRKGRDGVGGAGADPDALGVFPDGAGVDTTMCVPGPEVCNGLDDDCDGQIDNGSPCGEMTGQHEGSAYLFSWGGDTDLPSHLSWEAATLECAMRGYTLVVLADEAEALWVAQWAAGFGATGVWTAEECRLLLTALFADFPAEGQTREFSCALGGSYVCEARP